MTFSPIASSSDGNAYVVSSDNLPRLLIDAGVRFPVIQEALGFQVTALAGCLISHGHNDHCAAVPELLRAGVNVYAPKGFWQKFRHGIWQDHHRANYLKDQHEEKIGPWTIKPFEVPHDPGVETFGFLVSDGKKKLLYLTDAAWSPHRFVGLTHIVIEANWSEEKLRENSRAGRVHGAQFRHIGAGHQSIDRVERFFERMEEVDPDYRKTLEEVWLIHLSDQNSDEADFKERIQRITGCPVYVAAKSATEVGL